jgi:NAD(P)-dependent dehydrogenase (short-subunit alcohol dehydrogenase family)
MGHYKYCIVIGASRGLGAAIVEEFLKKESYQVIGVARTGIEKIKEKDRSVASGRYRHLELDITSPECTETLSSICSDLPQEPLCIIFNAALVEPDVNKDHSINYAILKEINRVGIDGLVNVLNAFEAHLLTYGGVLVGISSFSALLPPLYEPRVGYPASKAYLDMALRCLRAEWGKKVKVVNVHLGHLGEPRDFLFSRWLVTSYQRAAKKIVESISDEKLPNEINHPFLYSLVYRFIHSFVPDFIYFRLFQPLAKSGKKVKSIKP